MENEAKPRFSAGLMLADRVRCKFRLLLLPGGTAVPYSSITVLSTETTPNLPNPLATFMGLVRSAGQHGSDRRSGSVRGEDREWIVTADPPLLLRSMSMPTVAKDMAGSDDRRAGMEHRQTRK